MSIYARASKEEIMSATNSELIVCLASLAYGDRLMQYQLRTAKQIAVELQRRGILTANEFIIEYIARVCR